MCNDTYSDHQSYLSNFEKVVRQDFKENRPSYPNYYPTFFVQGPPYLYGLPG